jgi:hypothetical protein
MNTLNGTLGFKHLEGSLLRMMNTMEKPGVACFYIGGGKLRYEFIVKNLDL